MDKITKQLYETWAKIISEQMGQYSDQDATYNRTQGGGFGGGRPMPKPLPKPEPYPIPEPLPKPRPFPFPKPKPEPIPGIEPRPLPFPFPKPKPEPIPGIEPKPLPFPLPEPTPKPTRKKDEFIPYINPNPSPRPDYYEKKPMYVTGSLPSMPKIYEERDAEGQMAMGELKVLAQKAQELASMMKDDTQLEGWVQSKITKAKDYISSVHDYMNGNPDKID